MQYLKMSNEPPPHGLLRLVNTSYARFSLGCTYTVHVAAQEEDMGYLKILPSRRDGLFSLVKTR